MAPPKLSKPTAVTAWFLLSALSVTLRLAPAALKIAPPPPPPLRGLKLTAVVARFCVRELARTLRLARASLKIAPPPRPPTAWLFERLTPDRVRLAPVP